MPRRLLQGELVAGSMASRTSALESPMKSCARSKQVYMMIRNGALCEQGRVYSPFSVMLFIWGVNCLFRL